MFILGILIGLIAPLLIIQWRTGLIWDTIKPTLINTKEFLDKLNNFFRNLFYKK